MDHLCALTLFLAHLELVEPIMKIPMALHCSDAELFCAIGGGPVYVHRFITIAIFIKHSDRMAEP